MHSNRDNMTIEELKSALDASPNSDRLRLLLAMVLEDVEGIRARQAPTKHPKRYCLKDLVNNDRRNTPGGPQS